jgi:hypothetical protein
VLAHGDDRHTAEKVQNLQVAVRAARKRSQILAFADSDGRVTRRWLRALAAPLGEPGVGAVPRAHHRRTVLLLDAPSVGAHTRVQPAPAVARPHGAYFLLRGHGGVGDRLGQRLPLG